MYTTSNVTLTNEPSPSQGVLSFLGFENLFAIYIYIYICIQQAMLHLPTNTFNAYKLQGSLLVIMDLEKCNITSSVKLKNQLKIYFKQAFDLFLDLPQALTMNVSY